ncbi:MAG: DUF262 domain-containing protein [Planctomycetes bacterium]|nr:DUF262 domain-containing protein [Planctomycetota bacterium]
MAKVNLLNTSTANFGDLVGNGKIYRVPPYQRDYSWEEEQWEDLWNDIKEMHGRPDVRHYMGALVVEGKTDREFLIIDGQQRLATLSVLALAVIAKLQDMAAIGQDAEHNNQRAVGLRGRFIGEKNPASLVENSKLFLNETDNAFYQDRLVQLKKPLNVRGLPKSNRLLWESFQYFRKQLDLVTEYGQSGEALASLLSETVARQLMFILITVDDELNAYTVFETLNARGLELSATDLLKNYLLSRVKVATDLEVLQRRWKALILTVGQERFPEFLRYHLLCEQPQIRSQRLFKLVRESVNTPEEVFDLMKALDDRAELFSALSDPNHGYWLERPDCGPFIRDLNLFRVRQMTPLLFAAWEKLGSDFARVLKLVTAISFRYSIVSGLNTNLLEPTYHRAAKAVLDGHARTPAAVFTYLRDVYVDDGKFEQDFARMTVDTSGQRKKLAKYILAKLEADLSHRAVDPDTDPATIEHILPENPSEDWNESIAKEHWEATVYRLGNLVLLEAPLNRNVGNETYDKKVAAYITSNYQLAKKTPELAPTEWTLALVDSRQKRMAKRAVQLWRSDFP